MSLINLFRKEKQRSQHGRQLTEHYVPTRLPGYGQELNTVITGDYTATEDGFMEANRSRFRDEVTSLVDCSDKFTTPDFCSGKVDNYVNQAICRQTYEEVMMDLQSQHINESIHARKEELREKLPALKKDLESRASEIEKLPLRSIHEIHIGRHHISTGLVVSLICGAVDALLNYSFLEGLLIQNVFLLTVCVLGMSVISDGTMFVLGNMLSKWSENDMPVTIKRVIAGALVALFGASVVGSICIRLGSMAETFGMSFGGFDMQEHYSLAQWAISGLTALLTPCTGVISFYCSVDRTRAAVERRRELERLQKEDQLQYDDMSAELRVLSMTKDPAIYDRRRREIARTELEVLRNQLKQDVAVMLSEHQRDPNYTQMANVHMDAIMENRTLEYDMHLEEEENGGRENCETDRTVIDLKGVI